ncbi:hypothetical protein CPC16_004081 [Podila verticillata]|nr:hypothetical protein CPC16_004081 [Podila verticillata]
MGYNAEVVSITVKSPQHKHTLAKYALPQARYSHWCLQQDINPLVPNPPQLATWLASGMSTRWKVSMAQAYKKAVVAMYQDQSASKDVDFLNFMKRVNEKDIKFFRELDVYLTPILDFLSAQGPLLDLDMALLMQHLCCMLQVIGMLHPDSVCCIDMSDECLKIQEEFAILPITWPMETREGHPISWCLTIRKHDDSSLCPMATIFSDITSMPLIRSLKDYGTPVTSQTISNHAKIIMRMLPLAVPMTIPSGRATSSTLAFQQGAPSLDIVTYANWSSMILFDKYYRMDSVMKTNFSITILRSHD